MEDRIKVYASAALSSSLSKTDAKNRLKKVDVLDKKKAIATINGNTIDYSWLKGASETYKISNDIKDYCIVEVPIVTVDFPNRNLHSFPFCEVSHFDPRFGQFVYKTFVGKPTYADHCFPSGTMIESKSGLVPIEQIKVGDLVLTDKFRYKPVVTVFKNGLKKVTKIKIQGIMEDLYATENHPILVVDRRQVFGRYDDDSYQICCQRLRVQDFRDKEYHPHFRPISDTYVGDYVAIPINYGGNISANKSLAFLAGAYLADGCFTCKNENSPDVTCVLYTIGSHDVEFRNAIIEHAENLGYKPKYRPEQAKGCDWILIDSTDLCTQIKELCGEYSEHKCIQGDARNWDIESTKTFLGGYMSSDGCFDVVGSFSACTASKNLLKDLQQAFAFIGIPACIGTEPNSYLRVNQFFIPQIQSYVIGKDIASAASKVDSGRGIISDKWLLMPILKIERNCSESEVYNLEVEEDHTYVAGGIIVHNCNKNYLEAKGVHFDSSLRYVPGWDVWKIYVLLGYDRTKDASLVRQIETGQRRSYSMGAWCSLFINSITGQIENGSQPLKYPKGTVHNGKLSYSLLSGVEFFETSSVIDAADVTAESQQLWYF